MSEWNPPDRSRSRAVLIGTSRYDELTQVPAAGNSLESMHRLLTGPLCGWPADRVTRILEPREPGNLPDRLVELFGQAQDVALFYYVGHGQVDFEDQLCLGLAGSRRQSERRATTSLTFEAVRRALRASPAATKVVILDCCFAGHALQDRHTLAGADEVDIAGLAGASGAYTLAATGPDSTAWFESEADSPLPHTHFTRALVDAVARGIPDAAAVLTLEPVYHRLREILPAAGKPAPTRVSRHNADAFAFARNTAYHPAPVPPSAAMGPSGNPDARRRLLDLAEDAAQTIADPWSQSNVLIDIATEAARDDADRARRLLEWSERVTGTIKDYSSRADLWWRLASMAEASDPSRARRFLASAEEAITNADITESKRDFSIGWWSAEDPAVLRLDPDRSVHLAGAITDASRRGTFIARVVKAVAARDPNHAERLARIISGDAEHYGEALKGIAYAACDHDPDRAERIARAITDAPSRCSALAKVAASVASYDIDRAEVLLTEARRAVDRARDKEEISRYLHAIVRGLIGDLREAGAKNRNPGMDWIQAEAWRITRKIPDEYTAAQAAIALAEAIPGKPGDAREFLEYAARKHRNIQDPKERSDSLYILRDVAKAMIRMDIERAIDIVIGMELDDTRDQAILAIIPIVSIDDTGRAEVLAHHAARPGARARALSTVAAAMAESNAEAAITLLGYARRTGRAAGNKASEEIAREIAVFDPDLAVEILTEDGENSISEEGLAAISNASLKNDPERSERIAGGIADPSLRARVMTQIAAFYASPTQAKRRDST